MSPFKTQDPNLRAQLISFANQHGIDAAIVYEAILLNPSPEVKKKKPPRKGNGVSWYSIVFSRINEDTFTPSREILTGLDGEQRRRVLVALIAMVKKGYIERRGKYHEYEYRNLTPVNTEGLNDEGLFVAKGAEQASRKVKYGVNNG